MTIRQSLSVVERRHYLVSTMALALVGAGLVAAEPQVGGDDGPPTVLDYPELNNSRSQYATLNPEVMRGVTFDDQGHLFAINAYASSLLRYDVSGLTAGAPTVPVPQLAIEDRWRTLTDPVAVAWHGGYVFVVAQGNHALARHDPSTGAILEVVQLPSEPADMVIDDQGMAWISCMGADAVVRVKLSAGSMAVVSMYALDKFNLPSGMESYTNGIDHLDLKKPRFLFFDETEDRILVAPFVSGNGTFTVRTPDVYLNPPGVAGPPQPPVFLKSFWETLANPTRDVLQSGIILDGEAMPGGDVLPDNDLFSIGVTSGQVHEVLFDVTTLATAHGRHPNGDYWLLGVDSLNLNAVTEPGLQNDFVVNELTVVDVLDFPAAAGARFEADNGVDIDNVTPGAGPSYDSDRSLSFPYALEFFNVGGIDLAAVASSTTPRIALFDSTGTRIVGTGAGTEDDWELDLVPTSGDYKGLVARSLVFDNDLLWVYCQQTGNIFAWSFDTSGGGTPKPYATPFRELSLGTDPTPISIATGREIFYDATNSLNGRVSCNTCHPGGESDLLGWALSDEYVDFKGVMVTQPLKGAVDAFPFHWRGERDLIDFNGAFHGLLGGMQLGVVDPATPTSPYDHAEFDAFQDFVFALQPAANPLQRPHRQVDSTMAAHPQHSDAAPNYVGDPTIGLEIYQSTGVGVHNLPAGQNCANCHVFPTGSLGVSETGDNNTHFMDDEFWHGRAARESGIEIATLHNFVNSRRQGIPKRWSYDDPMTSQVATVYDVPLLGFGYLNSGIHSTVKEFLQRNFNDLSEVNAPERGADTAAFVEVFDSGTAPSVHLAYHMTKSNAAALQPKIQANLLNQALVASGPHMNDQWVDVIALRTVGGSRIAYAYNRATQLFEPDDFGAQKTLANFVSEAVASSIETTILGCLPGQGRRLGRDFDDDGLATAAEATYNTDVWSQHSDEDLFPDGYEVRLQQLSPAIDPLTTTDWADIQDIDVSLPSLFPSGTLAPVEGMRSGRVVKYFFETDEPTRWKLTATDTATTQVIESESATYGMRHTAILRGLRPSGTLDDGNASEPEVTFLTNYEVVLEIWDLADNKRSLPIFNASTLRHPRHQPGSGATGPGTLTQIVCDGGSYTLTNKTPLNQTTWQFDATFTLSIADLHTEDATLLGSGFAWVPVVNVLRRTAPSQAWVPVSLGEVQMIPAGQPVHYLEGLAEGPNPAEVFFDPDAHFDVKFLMMPPIDPTGTPNSTLSFKVQGRSQAVSDYAISVYGVFVEHASQGYPYVNKGLDRYRLSMTLPANRLFEGQ